MHFLWMVSSDFGPIELNFLDYFGKRFEGVLKLQLNCCMLVNLVLSGMIKEKSLKESFLIKISNIL